MAVLALGTGLSESISGAAYSWQQPHARVLATGDLQWDPAPFILQRGASVRYIDFDGGRDSNAGTSPDLAWKHHPWDPAATDTARQGGGLHTYIFRRGSIYRGALQVQDSGTLEEPIRLTSDPAWGEGNAVICGSERIGPWTRGATLAAIPEPDKVWWVDLAFSPRCIWVLDAQGQARRIPLARTPNWTVSDPDDVKSEWWYWDYKNAKPFDVFTEASGKRLHLGIDSVHLTQPADYYQDAILWTEHGWVMGAPYPVRVDYVDPATKGLGFGGRWGAAGGYKIVKYCRYFLEDKPHYLDDPRGEFWFDRTGDGGRLYLRSPGDTDPNTLTIEAAQRTNLIDATRMDHIAITGLTFRFTNPHWQLDGVPYNQGEDLDPACIRLLGPGTDIEVANCRFESVQSAVRMKAIGRNTIIDRVLLADNDVAFTDRGAFNLAEGSPWGEVLPASGLLYDVRILRNRLRDIGMRPTRFDLSFAVNVLNARTVEVAGTIVERCYGGGINVAGAKRSGSARDCPLSRLLIHHNKVTDSLLSVDDFGGIETWQGGPAYVFDNISGNPGGYRNFWLLNPKEPGSARFGHAYYLDGAFKNYFFNNIAWGKSKDPLSRLGNTAAFQEIISYQNTFFNNTITTFVKGTRRQAPQAGRDKFLGNVWQGIGEWLFWHAKPANSPEEGNAADAGPQRSEYALATNAYSRNVFYDISERFGVLEPSGRWRPGMDSFRATLAGADALAADVGTMAPAAPLRAPESFDFRLARDSAAIDQGVKVFVPWGLYAEVGEWNFYTCGGDPSLVLDEHWTMTPYHLNRDDYWTRPSYPLTLVNARANDYGPGPLEDWTNGALTLNGRDQYGVVHQRDLAIPFEYDLTYTVNGKSVTEKRAATGEDLKNVQVHTSSFLLEAVIRTEPGHTGGVLLEKMAETGYGMMVGDHGGVVFSASGSGSTGRVAGHTPVNDGAWHHVVAECDRASAMLTVYIDGKRDSSGPGPGPNVTLANDGDFHVGGTPTGRCLAGAVDFARVALGTLAEARTSIEELYAWEFDGPSRRDFAGRLPNGTRRDAGALEHLD